MSESLPGGVKGNLKVPEKTIDKIADSFKGGKPGKTSSADSSSVSSSSSNSSGQDTLSGGYDTMVGGAKNEGASLLSLTKLGSVKLPDLSGVPATGGVVPVNITGFSAISTAEDAVASQGALPAAQVDLTLIGQSIDLLTKKMGKMGGG